MTAGREPAGRGSVDEVRLVHGWMQRMTPSLAQAEELTVAAFRRLTSPRQPAWLARRPAAVRQRFSGVWVVLEHRGVV